MGQGLHRCKRLRVVGKQGGDCHFPPKGRRAGRRLELGLVTRIAERQSQGASTFQGRLDQRCPFTVEAEGNLEPGHGRSLLW